MTAPLGPAAEPCHAVFHGLGPPRPGSIIHYANNNSILRR